MAPNTKDLVQQGIDALQSGDKATARTLFTQARDLAPQNQNILLWLSDALESDDERRECLEQVLSIDPNSKPGQTAQKKLNRMGIVAPPEAVASDQSQQPPSPDTPLHEQGVVPSQTERLPPSAAVPPGGQWSNEPLPGQSAGMTEPETDSNPLQSDQPSWLRMPDTPLAWAGIVGGGIVLLVFLWALTLALIGDDDAEITPRITAEDIIENFQSAGLAVTSARPLTPDDYGAAPTLCLANGRRFFIPSDNVDDREISGRVFVCPNKEDADTLNEFYDEQGEENAALFSWTFQNGNVLVQIGGGLPQERALQYEQVVSALTIGEQVAADQDSESTDDVPLDELPDDAYPFDVYPDDTISDGDGVDMIEPSENGRPSRTPQIPVEQPYPDQFEQATATMRPTATLEPTPEPEPTNTAEPTPEPTATEEALPQPEPVVTEEPTPEPTPEPTSTLEPTPEPTATQEPEPTPEPPEPTPEETAVPEPLTFAGNGPSGTDLFTLPAATNRLIASTSAEGDFVIIAMSEDGLTEQELVNTTGPYSGTILFVTEDEAERYQLDIAANGDWTITVEALPVVAEPIETLQGTGDFVSPLFPSPAIDSEQYILTHAGDGDFSVVLTCGGNDETIYSKTGIADTQAAVRFRDGECFWQVQATGDWSIMPR